MGKELERLVLVCFRRPILASAALARAQLDNVGPSKTGFGLWRIFAAMATQCSLSLF